MTHFIRNGNQFVISPQAALDIRDRLPVGTYSVKFDVQNGRFYLDRIDDFSISGKIYGDTPKKAARIFSTFEDRSGSTGIMLSGEKGSGKTMLAKMLSIEGLRRSIPTLVVNQPFFGDDFNTFMQQIEQETVVVFDEFEKVYDRDDQEKMLTLLDGIFPSKKMFILTCNDRYRVDSHMKNRPGRIFYRIDYEGLDQAFVREYCVDNLNNQEHTESVCKIAGVFPTFNFDMLKALIEEMNRYDESPMEALEMLNAKPESGEVSEFEALLTVNDQKVITEKNWRGNPLAGRIRFFYSVDEDAAQKPEWESLLDEDQLGTSEFTLDNLLSVDPSTGAFAFQNPDGDTLTLTKKAREGLNWGALVV